jgi:hypothetical protein
VNRGLPGVRWGTRSRASGHSRLPMRSLGGALVALDGAS